MGAPQEKKRESLFDRRMSRRTAFGWGATTALGAGAALIVGCGGEEDSSPRGTVGGATQNTSNALEGQTPDHTDSNPTLGPTTEATPTIPELELPEGWTQFVSGKIPFTVGLPAYYVPTEVTLDDDSERTLFYHRTLSQLEQFKGAIPRNEDDYRIGWDSDVGVRIAIAMEEKIATPKKEFFPSHYAFYEDSFISDVDSELGGIGGALWPEENARQIAGYSAAKIEKVGGWTTIHYLFFRPAAVTDSEDAIGRPQDTEVWRIDFIKDENSKGYDQLKTDFEKIVDSFTFTDE